MLSTGSAARARKKKVRAGDCASEAVETGVFSLQDCEDDFYFENVGAVAENRHPRRGCRRDSWE